MDYGMENCSIRLSTPVSGAENHDNEDATVVRIGRGGSAELDVWLLDKHNRLNFKELSWETKPPRVQHMGTLTVLPGLSQELPGFQCDSGTYGTIEISCHDDCDVELSVTKREKSG